MVTIEGLGFGFGSSRRAGLSEEEICGIIVADSGEAIREVTPELFGMVKDAMIELFDDRYAALSEVVVAVATMAVATFGARGERYFQYRDFDNTKPLEFYGVSDPIEAMRWFSDVEGCFSHVLVRMTRRSSAP